MWIQFDGILNARDLGGLPAAGGGTVKPGRLLRGAALSRASDADVERLRALRLRNIVDFRDERERTRSPDRPIPGAAYHALRALPKLPIDAPIDGEPDFDFIFRKIYAELAGSEESAAAYREFFRILLECDDGAVYFHCTQGKDRTGIAALLALTALGVEWSAALEDYFLSNTGLAAAMERPESPGSDKWSRATREKLFFVFPEILEVYEDRQMHDWGGVDGYLRRGLGLTDADFERLRLLYLE